MYLTQPKVSQLVWEPPASSTRQLVTHIPAPEDLYCLPITLKRKAKVLIKVHKTLRDPLLKYSKCMFSPQGLCTRSALCLELLPQRSMWTLLYFLRAFA